MSLTFQIRSLTTKIPDLARNLSTLAFSDAHSNMSNYVRAIVQGLSILLDDAALSDDGIGKLMKATNVNESNARVNLNARKKIDSYSGLIREAKDIVDLAYAILDRRDVSDAAADVLQTLMDAFESIPDVLARLPQAVPPRIASRDQMVLRIIDTIIAELESNKNNMITMTFFASSNLLEIRTTRKGITVLSASTSNAPMEDSFKSPNELRKDASTKAFFESFVAGLASPYAKASFWYDSTNNNLAPQQIKQSAFAVLSRSYTHYYDASGKEWKVSKELESEPVSPKLVPSNAHMVFLRKIRSIVGLLHPEDILV